ncbi:MAG: hypothetical protein JXA30_19165 [Deltaproteobacteria bacterium]|nr:hypothetical protein [Deltaproteobacteria bacterium]
MIGFAADDYAQIAMMRGIYPVPRAPLSLFTFSDGSAAENRALRDSGFFPWWSNPKLRIAMWRPLSSALMWFDLTLFDLDAFAYHLHSFVLWVVMLALFALLLRGLLPPSVALFTLALFAFDEAHALTLGWIAMRNAILAAVFALIALILRYRALEGDEREKRWPSLLAFALALLSGEYAIAFVGYLLVLELYHSRGARGRMLAVAPWAAMLVLYFAVRAAFGYGSYASGTYLNPFTETGDFLREASARLPMLAGELALGIRSDFWTSGFTWTLELVQLGFLPETFLIDLLPFRLMLQRIGLFGLVVFALIIAVAVRSEAGRRARFLFLGSPLALLPLLSPMPESRVLLPAIFGSSAAFVTFIYAAVSAWRSGTRRVRAGLGIALGVPLLILQLVSGVYFGCYEVSFGPMLADAVRSSILDPKLDSPLLSAKRVLLFAAADATTSIYIPLARKVLGRPAPKSAYLLTSTFAPHRLTRVKASEFVLERLHSGYTTGDAYASTFNIRPLRAGQRFSVDGMQVTVESVYRGRPMRTRFVLDLALDDPRVLPLIETTSGLRRVGIPAIGGSIDLPPPEIPVDLMRF